MGRTGCPSLSFSKGVIMIGKIVTVTVDRPLGSYHPEFKDLYYPINYGYVEGIIAPDGEEQDAYILGVGKPVEKVTGKIIAVIHREDDAEEKWVVCPEEMSFTTEEIAEQVSFQEKYFQSSIITEDFSLDAFEKRMEETVFSFLAECFPESGKTFEINGRHSFYKDISGYFELFLCLFCNEELIGTVAVKRLSDKDCELKSLYLYKAYHGRGLGYKLLAEAVRFAEYKGYRSMYLDTVSTSARALSLYRRAGFKDTPRYNDNQKADIFMVLDLASDSSCF